MARTATLKAMNGGLQFATTLAFTSAAGLLMLASGSAKKLLRWKIDRPRRRPLRRR